MLRLLLVVSLLSGAGADPMIGELLHLVRSLEKRAASAAVTDSIAHRLANPASVINSIQRGTITVTHGGTSETATATATITSVTLAKSVAHHLGGTRAAGGVLSSRVELTDATTVTAAASKWDGGTTSSVVGYAVVEHK